MAYTGRAPSQAPITSADINDGVVTPADLSTGAPSWDASGNVSLDGAVVINESGADVDFRIESDTNANAFFLNGANGRVGIGTSTPQAAKFSSTASGVLELAGTKPVININETDVTDAELFIGMSVGDAYIGTTGNGNLAFNTGTTLSSERMRIDSSGNVGIGTSSPGASLEVVDTDNFPIKLTRSTSPVGSGFIYANGNELFGVNDGTNYPFLVKQGAPTNSLVINSSGNVGIGTSTPSVNLEVSSTTTNTSISITNTSSYFNVQSNSNDGYINLAGSGNIIFRSGTPSVTERMRIDSSGNLLVGTTSGAQRLCVETSDPGNYAGFFTNESGSNPFGVIIYYPNTINTSGSRFFDCEDNTAIRMSVRSNGGIANYQANDANLSDERVKTDIAPLGSMWDKFKAIEIVTFKYKDQAHNDDNIGVIAQQVEKVAPEFVDNDGFGKTPEGEEPLKAIYTADLYHAAIKALQEAMERIESLETRIAALESN